MKSRVGKGRRSVCPTSHTARLFFTKTQLQITNEQLDTLPGPVPYFATEYNLTSSVQPPMSLPQQQQHFIPSHPPQSLYHFPPYSRAGPTQPQAPQVQQQHVPYPPVGDPAAASAQLQQFMQEYTSPSYPPVVNPSIPSAPLQQQASLPVSYFLIPFDQPDKFLGLSDNQHHDGGAGSWGQPPLDLTEPQPFMALMQSSLPHTLLDLSNNSQFPWSQLLALIRASPSVPFPNYVSASPDYSQLQPCPLQLQILL